MSDTPEDTPHSPVGSKWRLFKTDRARNVGYGAVGVAALSLFALGINAGRNDRGPDQKPIDTGSTTISQVTTSPPPVDIPSPKTLETKVVYIEKPTTPPPAGPPGAVGPTNFVVFPDGGGAVFNIPAKPHEDKPAVPPAPSPESTTTTVAFKPSILSGAKAGKAIRLTYMMMPQLIPCALDVAMDSTLAGAITCHTTQDVLSPDHILLMPAGTQITGEYKNSVQNGQRRLFAFAGSAITKEGIPVPLDSGIADGLGRTGIDGEVDNHYAERFGAALLLTAGDAALQLGQSELSKGGNTNLNFNSGGGGGSGVSSIASQILQNQIGIPPTIYVQPGKIISIVVNHPISFEDAIRVSAQ